MRQEIPFSDARVKRIVQAAFPNARSRRTVKLEARNQYQVSDYWSEGSRNECRFVRLSDMSAMHSESVPREQRQQQANPFGLAIYQVNLTPGFVVVEHCIFCGKDLGYRIYYSKELQVSEGNELLLPAPVEPKQLTEAT